MLKLDSVMLVLESIPRFKSYVVALSLHLEVNDKTRKGTSMHILQT